MYSGTGLASLRVRKDINELSNSRFTCAQAYTSVEFPEGLDNMLKIRISIGIQSEGGPYANGEFKFMIDIPKTYPFHAPRVTCINRVWHPNIDIINGNVMFPILGKDWRPVLSINTVLLGLQLIFLEPNPENPLNERAAQLLMSNPNEFKIQVQNILRGGVFFGHKFESNMRNNNRSAPSSKRVRQDEENESISMEICATENSKIVKRLKYENGI